MESPQAFAALTLIVWFLLGSVGMVLSWVADGIALLSKRSVRRIPFDTLDNADFVFAGPLGFAAAVYAMLFLLWRHLRYWWIKR